MIKNAATTKAASNTSPGLLLLFYITIGTLPIYIEEGATNNTIHSNDFLENRVAANDTVGNRWSMEMKEEGLMGLLKGAKIIGNHYSDYDEPGEGCNDTNSDGFCDEPRTIGNGARCRAG